MVVLDRNGRLIPQTVQPMLYSPHGHKPRSGTWAELVDLLRRWFRGGC
jgi:hypothetical protein